MIMKRHKIEDYTLFSCIKVVEYKNTNNTNVLLCFSLLDDLKREQMTSPVLQNISTCCNIEGVLKIKHLNHLT